MLRKEQFLNVFIWVPFGSPFGSLFGSQFGSPFGSPFWEASDFGLGSGSHFGFVLVQEPESSWIGLAGGYQTNTLLDLTAPQTRSKEGSADERGGLRNGTATLATSTGERDYQKFPEIVRFPLVAPMRSILAVVFGRDSPQSESP